MFGCPDCPTCNLPVVPVSMVTMGYSGPICHCAKPRSPVTATITSPYYRSPNNTDDAAFLRSLGIAP